jgi:hypothetical protein
MKTKKKFILLTAFTLIIIFASCKSKDTETNVANDSATKNQKFEIPEVKKGNFYSDNSDITKSVILADTIVYYTVIKNSDPEDDWQEKCLSRLNRKALANIIFNAIYNGRLTAYNFMTEQPMTIVEVKEMEEEHPRTEIAKMEFTEEWYFNENDLSFSKQVYSIMLGYEQRNMAGEVKYFAGVKVYMKGTKKNINQIEKK